MTPAEHIHRLAQGKAQVGYVIGRQYTGKREWHWDSRTGVYSESLPLFSYDEWLMQRALVPTSKDIGKR